MKKLALALLLVPLLSGCVTGRPVTVDDQLDGLSFIETGFEGAAAFAQAWAERTNASPDDRQLINGIVAAGRTLIADTRAELNAGRTVNLQRVGLSIARATLDLMALPRELEKDGDAARARMRDT